MLEFKRNKDTGVLEVWKGRKKIGEIDTLGDEVKNKKEKPKGDKNGKH